MSTISLWDLLQQKTLGDPKVTLVTWMECFDHIDKDPKDKTVSRKELFEYTQSNNLYHLCMRLSRGQDVTREAWMNFYTWLDDNEDSELTFEELRWIEDEDVFEALKASLDRAEGARGALANKKLVHLKVTMKKMLTLLDKLSNDNVKEQIASIREVLLRCDKVIQLGQDLIEELLPSAAGVARSGYLKALDECIPRPGDRALANWREQFDYLAADNFAVREGRDEPTEADYQEAINKRFAPCDTVFEDYPNDFCVKGGADPEDALALNLAYVGNFAMARALQRSPPDPRHAIATHRFVDAVGRVAMQQKKSGKVPPVLYMNLEGEESLVESDPRWETLLDPDATGFKGVLSTAAVTACTEEGCLRKFGFKVRNTGRLQKSRIVAFMPDTKGDDTGDMHNAAMVSDMEGVFPPNTLFKVVGVSKEGWFTTPNGFEVRQTRIQVTATFRPGSHQDQGDDTKLCAAPVTLSYEGREAFVNGLDDITSKPMFTMEQEFNREYSWTDRKGVRYNLKDEWNYVCGVAQTREGCTPGTRDKNNDGKTLEKFVSEVNDFIKKRRKEGNHGDLKQEFALLTKEEVISLRLYSGPAYQPMNEFLRQLGKVSGAFRASVAKNPSLTFAATIGHIVRGIRKLAAVVTKKEASKPLWRGVRGVLPPAFWVPDKTGMVCATDVALMSTSRNKQTPIDYMGAGSNVLWQVQPQGQTDGGFHHGADIKMLSQFAEEDEVLFPPYTMLRVVKASDPVVTASPHPGWQAVTEEVRHHLQKSPADGKVAALGLRKDDAVAKGQELMIINLSDGKQVRVTADLPGKVVELLVQENEKVVADQVLIRLSTDAAEANHVKKYTKIDVIPQFV